MYVISITLGHNVLINMQMYKFIYARMYDQNLIWKLLIYVNWLEKSEWNHL